MMKKILKLSCVCTLFLFCFVVLSLSAKEGKIVREPVVAGKFYDSDPNVLNDLITTLLKVETKVEVKEKPIAMIAPHAGYKYSGLVAAHGYSVIEQFDYDKVIILAPSHKKRFRGVSIGFFTHYKTPLGLVEVDRAACDKLLKKPESFDKRQFWPFGTMPTAHLGEHSIEAQLPFLQKVIKNDFKIIPILVGFLKDEDIEMLAKALKPLISKTTLIVTSSDFMHYGVDYNYVPFKSDIEKNIKLYDDMAFESIKEVDFDKFRSYKMQTGSTICGSMPIALLLKTLPRTAIGQLIAYDTSGHMTNDFTFSVSYASLIFTLTKDK